MTNERFTKPNRETKIESVRLWSTKSGEIMHPSKMLGESLGLEMADLANEIWHVFTTVKTGFDRTSSTLSLYKSEAEAVKATKAYPEGSILPQNELPIPFRLQEIQQDDGGFSGLLTSAGDTDFFKCYDVLMGAGIIQRNTDPTKAVLDWLGEDRVASLTAEFSANWHIAAELEYCAHHFPRSSLAFTSSLIFFNYFITEDDFSAGYLLRELEFIMGGAEEIATSAAKLRAKAGAAGGEASRSAKNRRLKAFMEEIENLGDLFPRISERGIVDQAFQNAIIRDGKLWRQGKRQQAEYETELRSDFDLRTRYFALFGGAA